MAPSSRKDHIDDCEDKRDIFQNVEFAARIPDSFVAFKHLEREYGISLKVK